MKDEDTNTVYDFRTMAKKMKSFGKEQNRLYRARKFPPVPRDGAAVAVGAGREANGASARRSGDQTQWRGANHSPDDRNRTDQHGRQPYCALGLLEAF